MDTTSALSDPVTRHMHQEYAALRPTQTVGQALDWLREHPPGGRIIYLYVVDDEGGLVGVVPTRRLLLAAPESAVADIMERGPVTVPAQATVEETCEFFIQHRFLALPIVDEQGRLVGVVDLDLYTEQ